MSRKRDRASAEGLLPLMESRPWKDGKTVSYRYHPPGSKPTPWSTDKAAVMQMALDLARRAPDSGTFDEMWRLYQKTQDWADLAEGTRTDYRLCWTQLQPRFGTMAPRTLTALHCRRYLRHERIDAPVRANREMALLSNLCNVAIDSGDADINVCRHVRRNKERPRNRAPAVQTLSRFVTWAWARGGQAAVLAGMAEFAALSGNRRIEFRELHWPQVDEAVIRLRRAKQRINDDPIIEALEVSPALGALLTRMRQISGNEKTGPVFPSARGGAYKDRAFKSAWTRLRIDAMDATVGPPVLIEEQRFTFHDVRAFFVTEHKRLRGDLPDLHKDKATTARVYDRTREIKRKSL